MSSGCLGEHVGRSFGFSFPTPSIGPVASLATVRRTDQSSPSLNPQPTSTTGHDLRRVRVVQHHDRRARQIGAGVGQEIGGWLGHIFCGGARPLGARARAWRCPCVLGASLALWAASAWALTALILWQTLCRLRGRCTRPARALPFGTPWGGARGLVGRPGRLPSPESDWCAFGGVRPPVYARGRVHAWLACLEQSAASQKGWPWGVGPGFEDSAK